MISAVEHFFMYLLAIFLWEKACLGPLSIFNLGSFCAIESYEFFIYFGY